MSRSLTLFLPILLAVAASPAGAVTYEFATPISGDTVWVTMELTAASGGDAVDISVSIPPGEGDMLGVFGNVLDEGLVSQLAVDDPSGVVTQWQFQANKVWKVGGGNTMAPVKNWDWAVRLGENGSAGGAIESASFTLTAPGLDVEQLTAAANQGWVFGVRIQSTNGPEGSSKLGLGEGVPPVASDPPTITIDAPPDGTITAQTPVIVSGTVTGEEVTVTVNGVAATAVESTYTASIGLVEGPNPVLATAENPWGSATAEITVTLDTLPPVVTITSPADGAKTTQTSVVVEGTVIDASPIASFTVNGQDVPLDAGAFSTLLSLVEGDNPITAVAVDAAGNQGSDSVTVEMGRTPSVSLETPVNGALIAQPLVLVSGTVTGTEPLTLLIDGIPAPVTEGQFSITLPYTDGVHTVGADLSNDFGSDSDSALFTVDTTPPEIVILYPQEGALTASDATLVYGTVADATSPLASVDVNGVSASLVDGYFMVESLSLTLGPNPLVATASDILGHTASDSSSIERGTPPSIDIATPADGSLFVSATQIEVTGAVASDAPVTVTVNGRPASVAGGTYSATVPISEGSNRVVARAENAFGWDSDMVTVEVDPVPPPAVTITQPADGTLLADSAVLVRGLVEVNRPIQSLTVNGQSVPLSGDRFTAAVPIAFGPNPISALVEDIDGRTGDDAITVEVVNPEDLPEVEDDFCPTP